MRRCSDGEYYYAPKGRRWGVWQYHDAPNDCGFGEHIRDFDTKDDARREVYRLNGWTIKQ